MNDVKEYEVFLKSIKKKKVKVTTIRISLLIFFIVAWQVGANLNIIDVFLFSSPYRVLKLIPNLFYNYNLAGHIWATRSEILISFPIATILGIVFAVILWMSDIVSQSLEPYIVALNSLPKIAVAPIIIVWFGNNLKSIKILKNIVGAK